MAATVAAANSIFVRINMNALPLVGLRFEPSPRPLPSTIAEFLQPYIGAAWRLRRVMLSIRTMGLPIFLAGPGKHGILIPRTLISKPAAFTLLKNTAFNVETPAIKGRK
jgi:hypothetical protein